jgi:Leucine-rich repeat (LRR) protein
MTRLIINFLFIAIMGIAQAAFAQKFYVPDNNFRAHLASQYPFCMAGDSLLTDSATLAPITVLNLQNLQISDLSGIEYFTTLDILNCYSNQLSAVPPLPPSLSRLYCFSNQITGIAALPDHCQILGCGYNLLTELPVLPAGMLGLDCQHNQIDSLSVLPDSLNSLSCNHNLLTELPALPLKLSFLNCYANGIGSLPVLPSSLQYLRCGFNGIDSLPASLPPGLIELECNFNNLSMLPSLPASMNSLSFAVNNIDSVPPVPAGLTYLECYSNKLDFSDIVPLMTIAAIQYAPQDSIEISLKDTLDAGGSFTAVANTDAHPLNIYKWYKDNQALSPDPRFSGITSDTLIISPLQIADAGSYYCEITNSQAPDLTLYRRTISLSVNNISTGLPSVPSMISEPAVFPNPASDVLHLTNPWDHLAEARMMNLEGMLVWKGEIKPRYSERIDTGSFKRGFYFLIIEGDDKHFCKKIILQ